MKPRLVLQSALCFVLLLLIAVYAGRVLHQLGDWKLDPGGREPATLSPGTEAFLDRLQKNLAITFLVSSRRRMPSHLKEVEASVRQLLEALQQRAPKRIEFRVIDPEVSGAAGLAYAARHKVSPFSVRRVLWDEHREQKIWSSLVLAYEGHPEVLIQGVDNAHLPFLEELVVQHLKALEQPTRPTFAVAAPPSFQLLKHFLSEYGRVVQVDPDRQPMLPPEADVLFWMQPTAVTPEHRRQLRRFVDSGRSVILAGSAYSVHYALDPDGPVRYRARLLPLGWEELLQGMGLRPLPDLLMDRAAGPVLLPAPEGGVRKVEALFHLRCLPAYYNLKGFLGPARGGLSFVGASALEIDPRRVAAAGFQAEIVGTTTERTWVQALPDRDFTDADLAPALPVPKQNLMVLLKPDDPWKGQILVLASASPFQDGIINQPGYAHRVFLRTLARTFAQPQRLVRIRVERPGPRTIPPLGAGARLGWRAFTVFLIPLVLLVLGLRRYFGGGGTLPARRTMVRGLGGGGIVLLVLILAAPLWQGGGRFFLDLTEEGLHTLAPLTRRVLDRAAGPVQAELFASPRAAMPAALKSAERRIQALFENQDIPLRTLRPEHLSPREQEQLQEGGLRPFVAPQVRHDTLATPLVWNGLRLQQGESVQVIPRLDRHTMPHLEFLVVAALQRLEQGRAPHVAVVSDLPRLSPAEALEDFHKKGLIPPGGADVYRQLKSLLQDYGYRLSYVNPREPHLPEEADVVLWLQPRRDSSRIILQLSRHLSRGGRAIVALQHFNIQQRQYRGTGFQTVYWPQPQFQDLDRYLGLFGVGQVREVLMDRTQSHLDLETQINRRAVREYDPQQVALPFLIRAVGAHFAPDSPITRHLGDLLFIWGNRFALDPARLAAAGLTGQELITTSEQAWSYAWQGGFLLPEVFTPTAYLGRQPLAMLLEGRFPRVEFQEDAEGRARLVPVPAASPGRGRLLLIGCSEMFKNDYLYAAGFQHDQLLLNAVAHLAYGPELAALQARHQTPRGFAFRSAASKARWRLFAVGAGPLAILLYGLGRWGRHRRSARRS